MGFQKWLKENTGKRIGKQSPLTAGFWSKKKKGTTTIDRQFEYNTYVRDFFADNKGKSLEDAIKCWKYKKRSAGS